MRFADNFNPEWGYLAPVPGFMRMARITLVAGAVGAFAGGAVVFSLIEPPAAEDASVAARTLAQPVDSVSAIDAAQPTQAQAPTQLPPPPAQANAVVENPGPTVSSTSAKAQGPANLAAVAETPLAADAATASTSNETATASKKRRFSEHGGQSADHSRSAKRGPFDLLRSFAARATSWASPPRSDY
jgi:hypothetical protein